MIIDEFSIKLKQLGFEETNDIGFDEPYVSQLLDDSGFLVTILCNDEVATHYMTNGFEMEEKRYNLKDDKSIKDLFDDIIKYQKETWY